MLTSIVPDLKTLCDAKIGYNPQTATATVTGTGVDFSDYETAVGCLLNVGTVSGTTPTLDVKLQESDTSGGTYTDITGATFTQVTASNKAQLIMVPNRSKAFVRVVGTIAGTTPSFITGCTMFGFIKNKG